MRFVIVRSSVRWWLRCAPTDPAHDMQWTLSGPAPRNKAKATRKGDGRRRKAESEVGGLKPLLVTGTQAHTPRGGQHDGQQLARQPSPSKQPLIITSPASKLVTSPAPNRVVVGRRPWNMSGLNLLRGAIAPAQPTCTHRWRRSQPPPVHHLRYLRHPLPAAAAHPVRRHSL